jgi:hypothetical protein
MQQVIDRQLTGQEDIKAKSNADRKEMLTEIKARMDANTNKMKANMKATQERMDANTKSMREYIKSGHAEVKSTIGAIEEKMEAAIYFIRSEIEETIQHQMENIMAEVKQKTEGLRKELTETQKDLQVAKASLDTQRDDLMETIRDTKEYLELKIMSFKDNKRNLISTKQDTVEEKYEGYPTRIPVTVGRSYGQGREGKRNRSLCKRGPAAKVRRNYIVGRVPAPISDCCLAQLLGATGQIHIFHNRHARPGHRCAARHSEERNL